MVLAAALFAGWIFLQTPAVQTYVAQKAVKALEGVFKGRIEFSKIHLRPFSALIVKDLAVIDNEPALDWDNVPADTLAKARTVVATISLKSLRSEGAVRIKRLSVKDGAFSLVKDGRGPAIGRLIVKKGEKKSGGLPLSIEADRVQLKNFRFRLINKKEGVVLRDYGLDWKNLDLTAEEILLRGLTYKNGTVEGRLVNLSASERSGYGILAMSGDVTVGKGRTTVRALHLQDRWSDIRMDEYSMEYESAVSFSRFLREVRMTGSFTDSRVRMKSISYFAPRLRVMDQDISLKKAFVQGPVSGLDIKEFTFREARSGVSGVLDGSLTGIPSTKEMLLDFKVKGLGFTTEGLGTFIKGFAPAASVDLSKFASGVRFRLDGKVRGLLDRMTVDGKLTSSLGTLIIDTGIRDLIAKGKPKEFSGKVAAEDLELGRIAGISQIGGSTFKGNLDLSIGGGGIEARIDSLRIKRLTALGYDYSHIVATGTYSENTFDGRIVCGDPNLNFLFQGLVTLSKKTQNGIYKFFASIGYADLHALHLDKRETSKISGRVDANYRNIGRRDLIGDIDILGLAFENESGWHDIGDVHLKSHSNNNINKVNLTSSFANGSFSGSKSVTAMVSDLKALTIQKELPSLWGRSSGASAASGEYELRLDTGDSRDILSFIKPGLYIAQGTKVRMNMSGDGSVTASVKSPRVALKRNNLKDLDLSFDNRDSSLNAVLSCSAVTAGGMTLQNDNLLLYAKDDSFGAGFTYDNGTDPSNKGELYITGSLARNPDGEISVEASTLPSYIFYDGDSWTVSGSSIRYDGKALAVDNLKADCGEQSVKIDGGYSKTEKNRLSVNLVKFDLGVLNKFLGQRFGISGLATGHAVLSSPMGDDAGVMLKIVSDSTGIADREVGTLRLAGSLANGKLRVVAKNDLDGVKTLDVSGDYFPSTRKLDAAASLDGLDVGYIAPTLQSVFSEVGGSLSGKIRATGTLDSLSVSSEDARFDDVLLRVGYTNVPYHVSGPVAIGDHGLTFDNLSVTDRYDGKGTITGGITFDHLKNFRMDTKIKADRLEAIDLEEDGTKPFYGHLFASGDVAVKGPFEAILLDVAVRTDKEGQVHIPLDNTSSDGSNDLLTFKESFKEVVIDPYEAMMEKLETGTGKGKDFRLKLNVNAGQGTEAYVEIDRDAGNVLSARGQGRIDIEVRPGMDLFTINGDYSIRSGNFHFNAMDIAKRDFTISDGSQVRFNGDVMDSDLDIKGIYSTKASVATLLADTTTVSARRVVNCGIGVSGKLREPKLSFSIDVPDLDPTTKSRVESALNTEDKMQRQFLSLLISNSFMPDEQSGVVNNSSVLYSNVAEIMAGQLNNILQKLDIPLDFGLNYQASESGTNIFDVAVSTQLFNNRVIVNGNVGNREYSKSASSEGDVVGNLDIEIKIDKPGQLRLNLFSHSADDYTNYLDNTQRNGVGIAYQKEFNSLKEFFRDLFSGKKKRARRAAEEAAQPGRGLKTVRISSSAD